MGSLRYLVAAAAVVAGAVWAPPAAPQPLVTAIVDSRSPSDPATLARMRATGARVVRLTLPWAGIAPVKRPAGFDPADPADPAYRWDNFDRHVADALAAGLTPLLNIAGTPTWA